MDQRCDVKNQLGDIVATTADLVENLGGHHQADSANLEA
jgi:hypothetical protein